MMNPEKLRALLENNKPLVLGGGLVAVAGLAMWQKKKNAGASSPDAGAALSSGSQTAAASGGAAYDSSASDLYGAIQPQLEAIGQQLDQLQQHPNTIPVTPPPVHPVGPVARKPVLPPHKVIRPAEPRKKPAPAPAPHAAPKQLVYTVKAGDNLSKIAARYPSKTITANSIYSANRSTIGSNRNLIKPGQKLTIR